MMIRMVYLHHYDLSQRLVDSSLNCLSFSPLALNSHYTSSSRPDSIPDFYIFDVHPHRLDNYYVKPTFLLTILYYLTLVDFCYFLLSQTHY